MPRLFGTDGVRGLANGELTAALALGLAQASAAVPARPGRSGSRTATSSRPPSWESTTTASTRDRLVASPPKKSAVPKMTAHAVASATAVMDPPNALH